MERETNAMMLNTESDNPNSRRIDKLATGDILAIINTEDAKVALAVRQALPQIARAVDVIVDALKGGGRL